MSKLLLISPKDNNFYNFRSELILELKNQGKDVILVCPYGKKIDYFTQQGCSFIDIAVDRRGKNFLKDFFLLLHYFRIIIKEKPNIVLTYTTKPSVYAGFICGILKVPCIINNAGIMEAQGFFSKFMDLLYIIGFRKASCIMFQNDYERNYIKSLLNREFNYRRIPGSGVNIKQFPFTPYPESEEVIIFNYVALIKAIKGIDEFLECAKIIKEKYPKTRFRIYGEYDSTDYKEKIRFFEDQGVVEYIGTLLDIRPAITSCHAVIHPSYYEGMTNVILEHSAMGRVCIASDIPGCREAIEDGVTGYLFKSKNVASMISAIQKFIHLSHQKRQRMGIAARKKMVLEFDRQIVTRTYLNEIEKIINKDLMNE